MELEWPPAQEPGARRVWQQVLVPIAAELRAGAADLAERVVARQRSELPQLFPDELTVKENQASTDASLRQLAQIIEVGGSTIHSWTEEEIEKLRLLLPKIANGRKTRYQKLREKKTTAQPRAAVPHKTRKPKKK